jgi:hypothetical protein
MLAFEACGLFSDPENAYLISEKHYQESLENWKIEDVLEIDKAVNNGEGKTVRTDGLTDSDAMDATSQGD